MIDDKLWSVTSQENISRLEEGSEEENCNLSKNIGLPGILQLCARTLPGSFERCPNSNNQYSQPQPDVELDLRSSSHFGLVRIAILRNLRVRP